MRTAGLRNGLSMLSSIRNDLLQSPKTWPSFSQLTVLRNAVATRSPYTLRSISVNYSATPTVICSIQRGHSVAYNQKRLLNRFLQVRLASSGGSRSSSKTSNTVRYVVATSIAVLGLSYAAVPLYRLYCQASGYGGTVSRVEAGEKVEKMEPDRERSITIRFNADTGAGMRWHFRPQQREITVVPGETALAFYTARNPTDKPVTGISTYNVVPFDAGQYFNKIQCFCFEEQILNPNEQVDMPVFFYIDPEFSEDPGMARVTTITLSYTFFEAKEGESIYLPIPPAHHRQ